VFTVSRSGNALTLRENGVLILTIDVTGTTSGASGNAVLRIGDAVIASAQSVRGMIHSVTVAPTAAAADIELLEGWAAHAAGVAAVLDSGHPYAAAAPTIDDSTYDELLLAQSPTVYYRCDEADGAAALVDSSGGEHDATFSGGLVSTDAPAFFGAAVALDGSADYATIPASLDYLHQTGTFTINFWARLPGLHEGNTWAALAGNTYDSGTAGGRYGFGLTADDRSANGFSNRLRLMCNSQGSATLGGVHMDGAIPAGDGWHMYTIVGDGAGGATLYRDGVSLGAMTGDMGVGGSNAASRSPTIGAINWTTGPDESGAKDIAGFSVHPIALDAATIADLYAAGTTAPPAPTGPTIDVEPQSITVDENTTAAFDVTASGTGTLAYQWYDAATDGAIVGATSSSYSFTAVEGDDGNTYYCVVTDDNGTAQTATVTLTVTALVPVIDTEPQAQSVTEGETATFTVTATASAGTLTYQWYRDSVAISGATGASYALQTVLADDGAQFYVEVSDDNGLVTSATVALAVAPADLFVGGTVLVNGEPAQRTVIAFDYAAPHAVLATGTSDPADGSYSLNVAQHAGEVIILCLDDYGDEFAPSTAVGLGARIRPPQGSATGYVYVVTTAGTTGATEPSWASAASNGATLDTGTAQLTAEPLYWSLAHAPVTPALPA